MATEHSSVLVALKICVLFVIAGLFEIGGGWLMWQTLRKGKPYWMAICGGLALVAYGAIATLQSDSSFGRVFAAYGGGFIALSFIWARVVDGMTLDTGDYIGGGLAVTGAAIIIFWPRNN